MKSLKNCNCKNIVKSIAVKIAKQEVVAACPFISYQPRIPKVVLDLKNDKQRKDHTMARV